MSTRALEPATRNEKRVTRLTRRQLAAALPAATLSASALLAQAPNAPIPQTPDEELKAAREGIQRTAEQLAKFDLPMSTEPAVHFKA